MAIPSPHNGTGWMKPALHGMPPKCMSDKPYQRAISGLWLRSVFPCWGNREEYDMITTGSRFLGQPLRMELAGDNPMPLSGNQAGTARESRYGTSTAVGSTRGFIINSAFAAWNGRSDDSMGQTSELQFVFVCNLLRQHDGAPGNQGVMVHWVASNSGNIFNCRWNSTLNQLEMSIPGLVDDLTLDMSGIVPSYPSDPLVITFGFWNNGNTNHQYRISVNRKLYAQIGDLDAGNDFRDFRGSQPCYICAGNGLKETQDPELNLNAVYVVKNSVNNTQSNTGQTESSNIQDLARDPFWPIKPDDWDFQSPSPFVPVGMIHRSWPREPQLHNLGR